LYWVGQGNGSERVIYIKEKKKGSLNILINIRDEKKEGEIIKKNGKRKKRGDVNKYWVVGFRTVFDFFFFFKEEEGRRERGRERGRGEGEKRKRRGKRGKRRKREEEGKGRGGEGRGTTDNLFITDLANGIT
ncbi:hypothetical protein KO08_14535, partial [Listeria monocytogenes]